MKSDVHKNETMTLPRLLICPICSTPFDMNLSEAVPFCSRRCQQVDLSRWFNEEYGLPWEAADEEEHEARKQAGESPDSEDDSLLE